MADNERDYKYPNIPPFPPHAWGGPLPPPSGPWGPDDFFLNYRGRYSQFWRMRFGLIPELPTSFDNANDIYELLAWLQRGFKALLDDFANLELEYEEFKNAIVEMMEVLIPQLFREFIHSKEFKDRIYDIIWNWWNDYQEDRIRDIEERLEQLENIMFDTNYKLLTEGTDYVLTFFNSYYTRAGHPLKIYCLDSKDRYVFKFVCDGLENDDITRCMQNHGTTPENPGDPNDDMYFNKSLIFGLKFIGDYENVDVSVDSSEDVYSTAIGMFNCRPLNYPTDPIIQASWEPKFRIFSNYLFYPNNQTYDLVCTLRSVADGWNTQYKTYVPVGKYNLTWGTFVYSQQFLKEN